MNEYNVALDKCKRKLQLIKILEELKLAQTPHAELFTDGSGDIVLDDITYLAQERLNLIIDWCKKYSCTIGIIGSAQDKTIQTGWFRIVIYCN